MRRPWTLLALVLLAPQAHAASGTRPALVVPTLAQVFGPSSTPGGSSGQVQYNNAGQLGGLSGIGTSAGVVADILVGAATAGAPHSAAFDIIGASSSATMSAAGFGTATSGGFNLTAYHGRGNSGAITATQADDQIFQFAARGHEGTAFSSGARARFRFLAKDNFTSGAQGMYMVFDATASGVTAVRERMRIDTDGDALPVVFLGNGRTSATPHHARLSGTGGSGTNIAGGSVAMGGGPGTGTGIGGAYRLQTSEVEASGTTLQTLRDRDYIYAGRRTLTAGAATDVVRVAVAQGTMAGGVFSYCVRASDATDFLVRCGDIPWSVVNKAGAEECRMGTARDVCADSVTPDACVTSNLTAAFTCTSASADTVDIEINAAATITETALNVEWRLFRNYGSGAVTPQ